MKVPWIYRWYTVLAGYFWLALMCLMVVLVLVGVNIWVAIAVWAAGTVLAVVFVAIVASRSNRWAAQWRIETGRLVGWSLGWRLKDGKAAGEPMLTSLVLDDGVTIPFNYVGVPTDLRGSDIPQLNVTYESREVKAGAQYQHVKFHYV